MIDYNNSGAKALAEQSCEPKASDPAARAECMTKARDAFAADVLVFKQEEGGGRTTLTIFKRKGSALSGPRRRHRVQGRDRQFGHDGLQGRGKRRAGAV